MSFVNSYEIGAVGQDFLKEAYVFGREDSFTTLQVNVGIISIANEADNLCEISQLARSKGRKPKGGLHGFIFQF